LRSGGLSVVSATADLLFTPGRRLEVAG